MRADLGAHATERTAAVIAPARCRDHDARNSCTSVRAGCMPPHSACEKKGTAGASRRSRFPSIPTTRNGARPRRMGAAPAPVPAAVITPRKRRSSSSTWTTSRAPASAEHRASAGRAAQLDRDGPGNRGTGNRLEALAIVEPLAIVERSISATAPGPPSPRPATVRAARDDARRARRAARPPRPRVMRSISTTRATAGRPSASTPCPRPRRPAPAARRARPR
jgi:hypothetical protein